MSLNPLGPIADIGKEIIKPVYNDAVSPAAQEVGKAVKTVAGVINTALTPVALMVHAFSRIEENLKQRLTDKLRYVPQEEIVAPPLNIVGPLIEKYKYNHDNETLSELFVNLLANSMDATQAGHSHPAFIEIISQMSSDEARLFLNFAKSRFEIPKVDINLVTKATGAYNVMSRNVVGASELVGIQHPEMREMYIDNLVRLNLIQVTSGAMQEHLADDKMYDALLALPALTRLKNQMRETDPQNVNFVKGVVSVTAFGRRFKSAVTR